MNQPLLKGFNPALQILFFFILIIIFMGVGSVATILIGVFGFGISLSALPTIMSNPSDQYSMALMWMNNVSQLFTFLMPVLAFLLLFGRKSVNGLMLTRSSWVFMVVSIAFILAAGGLIDLSSQLNKLLIPEGSSIEAWAKPMEDAAEKLTKIILGAGGTATVLTAFFSIAVIPAVCEELAFRGVLQPLVAKATGNIHLAIWATAVAFSVFHMQFYGFLPRMIIGALLGYLVVWTGSIWPSILAHFANNAMAYILYQYYGSMDAPEGSFQSEWYTYLVSIAVTALIVLWYRKRSRWSLHREGYLNS